jgi:putative DNA primase/helicase
MSRLVVLNLDPVEPQDKPLDKARATLAEHANKLMTEAIAWHALPQEDRPEPPHAAIRITTGVGKSHALRAAIPAFIKEMKLRGLPHRVLILVPTHALGSEAKDMLPTGLTAEVWQGRGVHKVNGIPICTSKSIVTGESMCANPVAVAAAEHIGATVEEMACKQGKGDNAVKCPHFDTCAYQKQKAAVKQADIVFAAHELLFRLPATLGEDFGLVIVDEGFWQDGLVTSRRIGIEGLASDLTAFPVRHSLGVPDEVQTADLRTVIACLQDGLKGQEDGYVKKSPLIIAGLAPTNNGIDGSGRRAARFEWGRKNVLITLRPDAEPEAWEKASEDCRFLGQIPRRAAMWHAVDGLLSGNEETSGHLLLETKVTTEGSFRYLRVLGRKEVDDKILGLPVIHLDATMALKIVQRFMPRIEMGLDLHVPAPHERITQVIGLPVGKSSLIPGTRSQEQEERIARKRKALADFVRIWARGRRTLAITYKAVEDDFPAIPGVEVAHWGNIEGRDEWGDVALLVTAGRPMPGPADIKRMAAALTGRPVVVEQVPGQRTIRLKSGGEQQIQTKGYSDADAEMVRLVVAEAALAQGVGRGRGVKRGPGDPLEVFVICSDVAYPMEVDEVLHYQDVKADFLTEMVHAGIVPQFPSDAAKIFPQLFKSRDAAKQAYWRAGIKVDVGDNAYKTIFIRGVTDIVRYQPTGRGQAARLALVDLAKIPDPCTFLTAALGPLAKFEFVARPAPAPEPAPAAAVDPAIDAARVVLIAVIQNRAAALAATPAQAVAA